MAYYGHDQALRDLPPADMAPVIEWDDFLTYVFDWRQDQHVGEIGPTDSGKSTLTYAILPARAYTTFFGTKIKDKVLDQFGKSGSFTRIGDWPPMKGVRGMRRPATAQEMPRRLLWPDMKSMGAVAAAAPIYRRAVDDIYAQGGWCVVWDEFWMMCSILGLETEARILLQQARSNDISFVMGAQRPSRIPVEVYDQTTHLFFWRDNDEINLKRIGGIGWLAAGPIRSFVANLEQYQVLYINTRTGVMYRTTAPELALAA